MITGKAERIGVESGSEEEGLEYEEEDEMISPEGSAEADLGGIGATLFLMVTFLKRLAVFAKAFKGSSSSSSDCKVDSLDSE